MTIEIAAAWVMAILLCAVRLSVVFLMTPITSGYGIPGQVKAMLLLGMSAALVSGLNAAGALPPSPPGFGRIVFAVAAEAVTGAMLAFGVHTAFAAVSFAGKLIDVQVGFGIGNIYDPITHSQSPLIGSLFGMLAVIFFFATDTHHTLLRGLAYSMERLPLGTMLTTVSPEIVIRQFGTVFTLGLMVGAPLVFLLFLLDIGLGVLTRNLPQLNIFVIGTPVKIGAALAVLVLLGRQFGPAFEKVYASIFTFWEALLP